MSSENDRQFELALSNCNREPIRTPGRIQSFGGLLGFDAKTLRVLHASENSVDFLGVTAEELLGQPLDAILQSREVTHSIRGALGLPTIATQRERLGSFEVVASGSKFELSLSLSEGTGVLELEKAESASYEARSPVALVRRMISELRTDDGLEAMMESAVLSLRRLTGYDRVMAYKFLKRGDGEVIAEARGPSLDPYLGLRYPASDIPDVARALMVAQTFRVIADIDDNHSHILSDSGAQPLDLGYTQLRGVSPIHVEYLRNMGVAATMNLSLTVRGSLWGLFAFHHYRSFLPGVELRSVCELFGHLISMHIQQELESASLGAKRRADSVLRSLADSSGVTDVCDVVQKRGADLCRLVEADGVALVQPDGITGWGTLPESSVSQLIAATSSDDAFAIDSLDAVVPDREASQIAGALVTKLGPESSSSLVFYRDEILQTVRWAGGHEKQIEVGPNGPRLHPRASFEEYCESVRGRCTPWSDLNFAAAIHIRGTLRELAFVVNEASRSELKRQKVHQDLLIAELNHRVKNILALVRSIATQTSGSAESLEQYTVAFEQRIAALAHAHDLVGGSGVQWVQLSDLLSTELQAYVNASAEVAVSGPPVGLRGDVAPTLALLLHELASNAVKHGALSPIGTSLEVAWKQDSGGVAIRWTEQLSKPLSPPSRRGFGLTLLERAASHEIGGECRLAFLAEGLEARIWLPSEAVKFAGPLQVYAQPKRVSKVEPSRYLGLSAVVVEDNLVLAMEMESILTGLGFASISLFSQADPCIQAWTSGELEGAVVAILDINLGKGTSLQLGSRLAEDGMPVILVSGCAKDIELPAALSRAPQLTKPVDQSELAETLKGLIKRER